MLKIEKLSLSLEGENGRIDILKNINLSLKKNRLYVFTGPNGSGKSSLAKTIMGIMQPTSGNIYLEGEDITTKSISERAKMGIGYAFQQPPRFKGIAIGELLQLAAGKGNGVDVCSFLYDVGLCPQEYLHRGVDTGLSGGELKRTEIATLLAREKDLKLAIYDEPEAGIDLWSFSRLVDIFRVLREKGDATIVIISHQERILELADEIILLVDGQIQSQGSKEEIWPQIMDGCACSFGCTEREVRYAEHG